MTQSSHWPFASTDSYAGIFSWRIDNANAHVLSLTPHQTSLVNEILQGWGTVNFHNQFKFAFVLSDINRIRLCQAESNDLSQQRYSLMPFQAYVPLRFLAVDYLYNGLEYPEISYP